MRRLKLIDRYRRYFRFVRFSLGLDEGKEFLTGSEALEGFDWDDFWRFAKRQTLTGACLREYSDCRRSVHLGWNC